MQFRSVRLVEEFIGFVFCFLAMSLPLASAQSSQVAREWALFNQILMIGIVVGIVVFGLMFYAIIKYREKPQRAEAK